MKFILSLLIVLVSVLFTVADIETDEAGVLVLTDENFDTAIASNSHLLVEVKVLLLLI